MREARPAEGLYEDPGGRAGVRCWDGSAWSPLLPLSAGEGWPVWPSNPAWAALPVAPEPWVHPGIQAARAGAARAKFWMRVCAVPTAALLVAGLVAGLWSGNWFVTGGALIVMVLPGMFLLAAWLSWRSDLKLEKRQRSLSAEQTSGG